MISRNRNFISHRLIVFVPLSSVQMDCECIWRYVCVSYIMRHAQRIHLWVTFCSFLLSFFIFFFVLENIHVDEQTMIEEDIKMQNSTLCR